MVIFPFPNLGKNTMEIPVNGDKTIVTFDYHGRTRKIRITEFGVNNSTQRPFIRGENLEENAKRKYGTYSFDKIKNLEVIGELP